MDYAFRHLHGQHPKKACCIIRTLLRQMVAYRCESIVQVSRPFSGHTRPMAILRAALQGLFWPFQAKFSTRLRLPCSRWIFSCNSVMA